jgi:cobalt transporter subunit CbtA
MSLRSRITLRALLLPALVAGIAAGLLTACLQQLFLVPMILQAEALELGGVEHVQHGFDRALYTALFDCLAAFGFALLLAAAYAWRGRISWKQGLVWGLAGYASFALAPALGLPPELPGVQSAALAVRQFWWIATALATAGGIACIGLVPMRSVKLVGAVMIVLPHLIGAPVADVSSPLPAALSRSFALGSLAIALLMWIVIGVGTAALMKRTAASAHVTGGASRAGT